MEGLCVGVVAVAQPGVSDVACVEVPEGLGPDALRHPEPHAVLRVLLHRVGLEVPHVPGDPLEEGRAEVAEAFDGLFLSGGLLHPSPHEVVAPLLDGLQDLLLPELLLEHPDGLHQITVDPPVEVLVGRLQLPSELVVSFGHGPREGVLVFNH